MIQRTLLALASFMPLCSAPKLLHLSFHKGCINDFNYVAQQLNLDLTSILIHDMPPTWLDGKTTGNARYNIGHQRAQDIWNMHKNYFDQFDAIITSDTAPLARIFLQNGWKKPLIIWVCNRFDYHDGASLDCDFPDQEYYHLFQDAAHQNNVKIIAYTPFEQYYANTKGVNIGTSTIKPCAYPQPMSGKSHIPPHINKQETFFIPPYHNDTIFMDLQAHCKQLGIPAYCGRYNGPDDLQDFKGIIHLPYAWSNLALFENIQKGIPYFIPSKEFLLELALKPNYFFMMLAPDTIELSEWYCPELHAVFTYFDSWEDLKVKIATTNFTTLKEKIKTFGTQHHDTMLNRWKSIFEYFFIPTGESL